MTEKDIAVSEEINSLRRGWENILRRSEDYSRASETRLLLTKSKHRELDRRPFYFTMTKKDWEKWDSLHPSQRRLREHDKKNNKTAPYLCQ